MRVCYFVILDPSNPSENFVAFFMRGKALPPDIYATVSANYTSATGKYMED